MHGECARRAGYYMECGKSDSPGYDNENSNDDISNVQSTCKQNSKSRKRNKGVPLVQKNKNLLKIFCERHRPFRLIKEIQEKQEAAIEEVQKFCKSVKRAVDVMARIPYKCKHSLEKKWKEKDKKVLLEKVKERYLLMRKLRINIVRVDPNKRRKRGAQGKGKYASKRRKTGENSESKSAHDIASINNESSIMSSKAEEVKEIFYKLANPCFPQEPDWSITLSRNDFPWYDIKFNDYTAQECFDMYRSLITDEDTFNRKVRKEKKAMINKLAKENKKFAKKMEQKGVKVRMLSKKDLRMQAEKIKQLRDIQMQESENQLHNNMSKEEILEYNKEILEMNQKFCSCRGKFGRDLDDFYVYCDGEDCENNNWYHWK
jgi:hypothetical protein